MLHACNRLCKMRQLHETKKALEHDSGAFLHAQNGIYITFKNFTAGQKKGNRRVLRSLFNTVVGERGDIHTEELKFLYHVCLLDLLSLTELSNIGSDADVVYLDNPVNAAVVFHAVSS